MEIPSFCLFWILHIVLIEGEGNREGYSASKSNAWPVRQYFKNQLEPHYARNGHGQIVGGKYIKSIKQYPYMAFLSRESPITLSNGSNGTVYEICGATILTTKHLLTAAHCLTECSIVDEENLKPGDYVQTICKKNLIKDFTVFVGSTVPRHAPEKRKLKQCFIHPDFDVYDREKKCGGNNDIAIVELKTAVTFTNEISFVTLPPPDFKNTVHMKCHVLGWGETEDKYVFGLDVHLKFVSVNYINNPQCLNHIKYLYENITDKEKKVFLSFYTDYTFCKDTSICSLNKKKGSCLGDSGGPILCNGVQVGVSSSILFKNNDKKCLGPHQPHVYMRVDKYLKWLNSITS